MVDTVDHSDSLADTLPDALISVRNVAKVLVCLLGVSHCCTLVNLD